MTPELYARLDALGPLAQRAVLLDIMRAVAKVKAQPERTAMQDMLAVAEEVEAVLRRNHINPADEEDADAVR